MKILKDLLGTWEEVCRILEDLSCANSPQNTSTLTHHAVSPEPTHTLKGVQKGLMMRCQPPCIFLTSRKPFFISFSSKSTEVSDWKQKLQNQSETFKLETKKKEGDILSKEKHIQQLLENCKNLEKRVAEYSQARSEVEEKSASSLEEIKVSCPRNIII